MKVIEKKILNKLLDRYEGSKSFVGLNKVEQTFAVEVAKLFPRYIDDSEYDFFIDVNDSIKVLVLKGFVNVTGMKNGVIQKVILNVEMLEPIYLILGRTPKKDDNQWLESIWNDLLRGQGNIADTAHGQYFQMLSSYIAVQRERLGTNKPIGYFDGNRKEYVDLLKAVKHVVMNRQERYIRDFSIELFGDSKRMEKLKGKVQSFLFEYGDYEEMKHVLEECGVVDTPTYVALKGNAVLSFPGQNIDLSVMKGDIALSTESIKELTSIKVLGERVVTVENLTSFHDFPSRNDFVIYLGGFHNRVKRELIQLVYSVNQLKPYCHFGDIDAGGFYIFEHLCKRTGIHFNLLYMGADELERYKTSWKALTGGDRKRIQQLIKILDVKESKGPEFEDYRSVLYFMLENNCKLEQEAIAMR